MQNSFAQHVSSKAVLFAGLAAILTGCNIIDSYDHYDQALNAKKGVAPVVVTPKTVFLGEVVPATDSSAYALAQKKLHRAQSTLSP